MSHQTSQSVLRSISWCRYVPAPGQGMAVLTGSRSQQAQHVLLSWAVPSALTWPRPCCSHILRRNGLPSFSTRAGTCTSHFCSPKPPGSAADSQFLLGNDDSRESTPKQPLQSCTHKVPHIQLRAGAENLVPNALRAVLVTI